MSGSPHAFLLGGPNKILKCQPFAAFCGRSSAAKRPEAKQTKMYLLGRKGRRSSNVPCPERVKEVYGALISGLDECLKYHQNVLDNLTVQLQDMTVTSKVRDRYNLEKQTRTTKSYIQRLRLHINKVEDLYENYCIQKRIREGACRMKQAFAASSNSKASRQGLCNINKHLKEYARNMATLEAEMENLIGEFYIKMKGLAGFARLCPGDLYEVFMTYGCQQWKLKGKIEAKNLQSWDGLDMFFRPSINSLFSINVAEVKAIVPNLPVGSVSFDTKNFFTAPTQTFTADVNELGTIGIHLEVTWCPFKQND
ncbi:rho family-interacting cell polarization regulator 2-like [Spea bombifrons]|uniref:rho family-interacting cell polarization regulator 2-like n=1 Tax=Spea bombifrons TaxID=233779 RepID=UPI00234A77E3|nr:rho family-interacting cell polarization regulator 2-like [Spea bombifrons]